MSEQKKHQYIAIAGNIGAGKSSLTGLLAQHFGWQAFYESVDDNPYLADFYEDMLRWSFNLQIYFLSSRFRHQKDMLQKEISLIQDRTIYEDVEIFAKNLHQMSLMSDRDFNNYEALFHEMSYYLRPPDLLIYLRSSIPNLVNKIHKRGREYENSISIEYLSRLNERYEAWISTYDKGRLLVIDVDNLDFVDNKEDLGVIIERVDAELNGLF